jgi:hypothetical protein
VTSRLDYSWKGLRISSHRAITIIGITPYNQAPFKRDDEKKISILEDDLKLNRD